MKDYRKDCLATLRFFNNKVKVSNRMYDIYKYVSEYMSFTAHLQSKPYDGRTGKLQIYKNELVQEIQELFMILQISTRYRLYFL